MVMIETANSPTYLLDPEGDVIFTLTKGCTPFAASSAATASIPWNSRAPLTQGLDDAPRSAIQDVILSDGDATPGEPGPMEEAAPEELPAFDQGPMQVEEVALEEAPGDCGLVSESIFTFRLSSRHLVLASAVFKKMLSGQWVDHMARDDGYIHISGEDWDEEAFLILMRIIHGLNRKIPRSVDLELLAKVSVIVDYYELHEASEVFGSLWIAGLGQTLPSGYCRELILWTLVSMVFGEDKIFKAATESIVRHAPGRLNSWNLPLIPVIEEEIMKRRTKVLDQLVYGLHALKEELLLEQAGCSFACRCMCLGALMKGLRNRGILDPLMRGYFQGKSLAESIVDVRRMKTPKWSDNLSHRYPPAHQCSLGVLMEPFIQKLETAIEGLSLADFNCHPRVRGRQES